MRSFLRTFATGVTCRQETLTPPDAWSHHILKLHVFYLLRLILFPNFFGIFPDYALRASLGTFSIFALRILCVLLLNFRHCGWLNFRGFRWGSIPRNLIPTKKRFSVWIEKENTRVIQKVLLCTKCYVISNAYPYLVYSNLFRKVSWKKPSLINHEIFSLNAAELSTLMHVWDTDKFHFHSHFHIIKLIKQCLFWQGK